MHGIKVMFGFWYFLSCCGSVHTCTEGNKRSEDPGDEEYALEPTVQIADRPDRQFFKMADGRYRDVSFKMHVDNHKVFFFQ